MLHLLFAAAPLLASQSLPAAPLDPFSVQGLDESGGAVQLDVMPHDRDGDGGATYTLKRGEAVVWQRDAAFALREAWFGPGGRIAGYALREDPDDELVVALFDADGSLLGMDAIERVWPGSLHAPLTPSFRGLHSFAGDGRFIVRRYDRTEESELWRAYSWTTGEVLPLAGGVDWRRTDSTFGVRGGSQGDDAALAQVWPNASFRRLHQVLEVPDAPLLLERWSFRETQRDSNRDLVHSLYALIDAEGRCVWRRFVPSEISDADVGQTSIVVVNANLIEVGAEEPVFRIGPGVLEEVAGEAPAFQITREGADWRVQPTPASEHTFVAAEQPVSDWARFFAIAPSGPEATLEVELLDSRPSPMVALPGLDQRYGQLHAPGALDGVGWQVTADGELWVVDHDAAGRFTCTRYGPQLEVLGRTPIADLTGIDVEACSGARHVTRWFPLAGGRWFVAESSEGLDTQAIVEEYVVDGRTGEVRAFSLRAAIGAPATDWWAPLVASAHSFADGGILLDVDRDGHGDDGDLLVALDGDLDVDWMRQEAPERGARPRWESIAVQGDRVYGLDAGEDRIEVWSRSGRRGSAVDLQAAFSAAGVEGSLGHARTLEAWHQDGLLISEAWDPDRAFVLDLESEQLRVLSLGGSVALGPEAIRSVRAQPDGRPWLRTRGLALRFEADGEIGGAGGLFRAAPPAAIEPSIAKVLQGGRVAVFDAREARLSIWDPATGAVETFAAEPGHAVGFDRDLEISERGPGDVVVHRSALSSAFDELVIDHDQGRLVRRTFAEETVLGPDSTWSWDYPGVLQVSDPDGDNTRTLERHGAGLWWLGVDTVAFAPDGSVWVWEDDHGVGEDSTHQAHRVHYSARGEELACWPANADVRPARGQRLADRMVLDRYGSPVLVEGVLSAEDRMLSLPELPDGPAVLDEDGNLLVFELETLTLHRYRILSEVAEEE